jgi:hypothetical protein
MGSSPTQSTEDGDPPSDPTVVSEVNCGLVTKKRTQGGSVRSGVPCGAPPALVLLPAAVASSFPQQPVRLGRGMMKWRDSGDV